MSEPIGAEEIRSIAETDTFAEFGAGTVLALLDHIDRLTEALEAAERERDASAAALRERPERTTVWQDASDEGYRLQVAHAESLRRKAEADLADEKRRRAAEIAEAWERGHEVCEWPGCARTHVNPYALLDTATEETQR